MMTNTNAAVWRAVVATRERMNPGFEKHWAVGGSRTLVLACGHEIHQKLSQRVPKRCRCRECSSLLNGARRLSFTLATREITEETWNPETSLPHRVRRPMTEAEWLEYNR